MGIQLESIIPQDDEFSPPLRKSTRGMRAVKRSTSSSDSYDITGQLNAFAESYGFLTGSFVVLFLFLWVFLYSFNFEFVQQSKDSKHPDEPDKVKVFFWALFIAIIFVVVSMLWMGMLW